MYFKSKSFLIIKQKVSSHIKQCNELNTHIESLKNSYKDVEYIDYGEGELNDNSTYNMKRYKWAEKVRNRRTYQCSLSVVKNADDKPFKYFCKYFDVKPNEETLEKFEKVLNDFAAAEQGKVLLGKEKEEILSEIHNDIPSFIHKHHSKRIEEELGFDNFRFSDLYFPEYTFQYVSAGGNSRLNSKLVLNIDKLERFVKYLSDLIEFKNSVAGQRALMTPKLREKIKSRDDYTCQKCGLSTRDERNLLLEIDHIIPLSRGGITSEANLQTLCWRCNRSKGAKIDDSSFSEKELQSLNIIDSHRSIKIEAANSTKFQPINHISNKTTKNSEYHEKSLMTEPAIDTEQMNMEQLVNSEFIAEVNHIDDELDVTAATPIHHKKYELSPTQKRAVKSAKEHLEYTKYSRSALIDCLYTENDYSEKDAIVAVDSLNLDWGNQAIKSAKEALKYSAYSREQLINQLFIEDGYSLEEATLAVDKMNIDWKKQAIKSAKQCLKYSSYSREKLINELYLEGEYSLNEATAAVDLLNIDWNQQAVKSAKSHLKYSEYSHNELFQELHIDDEYTKNQANYAVEQIKKNK
ncbi:Ltp family lipoprotein [Psychrobacter aestuarii]|uniref:HNH nuclease domain-containing protein n=1 Tax=Psychrobacter aestuarii TaxID=556327 RepID=A0ABP3FAM3_9GAMM|nr:Ltp family lipoprotein [Psychrobacter aestuarii]